MAEPVVPARLRETCSDVFGFHRYTRTWCGPVSPPLRVQTCSGPVTATCSTNSPGRLSANHGGAWHAWKPVFTWLLCHTLCTMCVYVCALVIKRQGRGQECCLSTTFTPKKKVKKGDPGVTYSFYDIAIRF